jgi:hypothetical protein
MRLTFILSSHKNSKANLQENGKTPIEQIEYVKNTNFKSGTDIISCSPYIFKALVNKYKEVTIDYIVGDYVTTKDEFWYQFDEPMRQLFF